MAKAKTGLGRGLDLLIPGGGDEMSGDSSAKGTETLRLSQIEPNRDQPRKKFDKESIEELASSIKQYGVIQPIIVCKKNDYYEIIAGERRWRAAKKAGLKEIPVIIRDYSDREIAEISLIENIQREDLNPIEEAKAYKQLIDEYGLKQDELAQKISKSRANIANTMRLLKLHDKVQKMLADNAITAGHARALLAIEDKEIQLDAAEQIIKYGLSVRDTESLVKRLLSPKTRAKAMPVRGASYKEIEKRMSDVLGAKVSVKEKANGQGKVEISYANAEQLDQIYKIINKGAL